MLTGLAGAGNGQYAGGKGGVLHGRRRRRRRRGRRQGLPGDAGHDRLHLHPAQLDRRSSDGDLAAASGLSLTSHSGANATSDRGRRRRGQHRQKHRDRRYVRHRLRRRGGGLTDTWDGGGPGATINVASGTVTTPGPDNTAQGAPGAIPGQAGAGSIYYGVQLGGGCNLLIIARA